MRVTTSNVGGEALRKVGDRAVVSGSFHVELDREDHSPLVRLDFEVLDGVPQCRQATITSRNDGREVLSSDLRGVKIEDELEQAVIRLSLPVDDEGKLSEHAGLSRKQVQHIRSQARRKVTPELLREVAEIYRANVDAKPTEAVADHFGVAHRTATWYVQEARKPENGFLGPAIGRGRAGEAKGRKR